mmetsp:Transcript_6250/g.23514  ORF Transcript_6250/g.23514 Transcript_6250/m.23514 type:complete len:235 (+) Transcript_6250:2816-3520(+)
MPQQILPSAMSVQLAITRVTMGLRHACLAILVRMPRTLELQSVLVVHLEPGPRLKLLQVLPPVKHVERALTAQQVVELLKLHVSLVLVAPFRDKEHHVALVAHLSVQIPTTQYVCPVMTLGRQRNLLLLFLWSVGGILFWRVFLVGSYQCFDGTTQDYSGGSGDLSRRVCSADLCGSGRGGTFYSYLHAESLRVQDEKITTHPLRKCFDSRHELLKIYLFSDELQLEFCLLRLM